jgi:hypothetical protein
VDAVTLILALAGIYVLAGIVFGVAFVVRGASRIDPAARGAGVLVRVMWFPGAVALWPVLLKKWMWS